MLHIVAFDVPYPADYGGAIDVFYKIKALHAANVKITLHCFTYRDRQPNTVLNKFCEKVLYYKRDTSFFLQFSKLPYIVSSRKHSELLKNLCADNAPILFEGLHTCAFMNDKSLLDRKKMVRMHNIEWQYYKHLADAETNVAKKLFFSLESTKLKKFEETIFFLADKIFCISQADKKYFLEKKINKKKIIFLPPFHAETKVISKIGRSDYILFHGDLSVNDNVISALELIENVFSKINTPCIIAGKNPNKKLIEEIALYENIQLESNPEREKMLLLIQNAHINILYTRHTSGMKLKLLHALFAGRFCLANPKMVRGTGMENLCENYNSFDELKMMISERMNMEFQHKNIEERRRILGTSFSNTKNAEIITGNL